VNLRRSKKWASSGWKFSD